jgi:lipopolysaccharide transport system ATP-binding protein
MSDRVIRIENLGKKYLIGHQAERGAYTALRDVLIQNARGLWHKTRDLVQGKPIIQGDLQEEVWALKDINFDVFQGQAVGIIGRNGAGKSTLLKILSRITEPSVGRVTIKGRVASLLEVGTGFHPELSGRENIYLNGAILGMTRAEIRRRFDEIVAFAEVEKFLDTPVKRYSSGMYVRLAFAVAAHLEPEILIVDEVLAVGDAEFQKKCLNKMQEISHVGRTILFVSHNFGAVRNICRECVILDKGRILDVGETDAVVDRYLASLTDYSESGNKETKSFVVDSCTITSVQGSVLKSGDQVTISVRFTPKIEIRDPGLYVGFLTIDGERLAGLDFKDFQTLPPLPAGEQIEMGFCVQDFPLLPGHYALELHLKDMSSYLVEPAAQLYPFEVVETPIYGGRALDGWFGHVRLQAVPFSTRVPTH